MTRALQRKKTAARRLRRHKNKQKWKESSETEKQRIRQDWIDRATKRVKHKEG